mmetsp:Transcript_15148/g.19172  ORF Transcript_15148/g.19172 Transcript_15148/m.19172 type:complete len:99 (-) Transcript_15148:47-343(-)
MQQMIKLISKSSAQLSVPPSDTKSPVLDVPTQIPVQEDNTQVVSEKQSSQDESDDDDLLDDLLAIEVPQEQNNISSQQKVQTNDKSDEELEDWLDSVI